MFWGSHQSHVTSSCSNFNCMGTNQQQAEGFGWTEHSLAGMRSKDGCRVGWALLGGLATVQMVHTIVRNKSIYNSTTEMCSKLSKTAYSLLSLTEQGQ